MKHPAIRHTSPFMLLEALDLVFSRLQKSGVDLGLIGAVKIDAMQHCTVYADASFGERVESLDAGQDLLPQLEPSITRRTSPIWEDRSPVKEAEYLAQRAGEAWLHRGPHRKPCRAAFSRSPGPEVGP